MQRLVLFVGALVRRNAVALLALFVALGGTSYAAAALISGTQIKPHSIPKNRLTSKAIVQLKGNRGARGLQGARGPTGAQGIQGQQGAQGPPGSVQDTVRHVTGFILNGTTASTPVRSGAGLLGTLSITCSDLTYRTDTSDTGTFADRVLFYSPQVPSSPLFVQLDTTDHLTVTWSDPAQSRWFQMQIEGTVGDQPTPFTPTLTQINGFVKGFPEYQGCAYYVYVETSDIASPQTITP